MSNPRNTNKEVNKNSSVPPELSLNEAGTAAVRSSVRLRPNKLQRLSEQILTVKHKIIKIQNKLVTEGREKKIKNFKEELDKKAKPETKAPKVIKEIGVSQDRLGQEEPMAIAELTATKELTAIAELMGLAELTGPVDQWAKLALQHDNRAEELIKTIFAHFQRQSL